MYRSDCVYFRLKGFLKHFANKGPKSQAHLVGFIFHGMGFRKIKENVAAGRIWLIDSTQAPLFGLTAKSHTTKTSLWSLQNPDSNCKLMLRFLKIYALKT